MFHNLLKSFSNCWTTVSFPGHAIIASDWNLRLVMKFLPGFLQALSLFAFFLFITTTRILLLTLQNLSYAFLVIFYSVLLDFLQHQENYFWSNLNAESWCFICNRFISFISAENADPKRIIDWRISSIYFCLTLVICYECECLIRYQKRRKFMKQKKKPFF